MLIAGILIGIFARPELPELLRWSFFYLFLFAIGYSGARSSAASRERPLIVLALVVALTGLALPESSAAATSLLSWRSHSLIWFQLTLL
jgi:hypothetical protein